MTKDDFKILKKFLKSTLGNFFDLNKEHALGLNINGQSFRKGYKKDLSSYNLPLKEIEVIVQITKCDNFLIKNEVVFPVYEIKIMIYNSYFNFEGSYCDSFDYIFVPGGEVLKRSDFLLKYN